MPVIVGLVYIATLALVLMFATGGWSVGVAVFLILLWVFLRESPRSHVLDTDTTGHGEKGVRA